jgi:hypothetical protein
MQEFIRNLHPRQGYKNDLACRTLVFAFSDILQKSYRWGAQTHQTLAGWDDPREVTVVERATQGIEVYEARGRSPMSTHDDVLLFQLGDFNLPENISSAPIHLRATQFQSNLRHWIRNQRPRSVLICRFAKITPSSMETNLQSIQVGLHSRRMFHTNPCSLKKSRAIHIGKSTWL